MLRIVDASAVPKKVHGLIAWNQGMSGSTLEHCPMSLDWYGPGLALLPNHRDIYIPLTPNTVPGVFFCKGSGRRPPSLNALAHLHYVQGDGIVHECHVKTGYLIIWPNSIVLIVCGTVMPKAKKPSQHADQATQADAEQVPPRARCWVVIGLPISIRMDFQQKGHQRM
ncbi:hypothetical protein BDK51DRAFT_32107 [Blyttiomyces helicus]|uniref:Uncharacterized protein n=1 Tax=Blyttiomyces helicus TaxID=388810 RepID=A0A4P9W4N1_9FUNG|nr:hypothetical protein BDK51DRAFT_32107 [Blyttiomyces helicus]|eukprot:RKO85660.1 hypothetical protein BDK51DRAFT_32107 [Blyttiomyces helicus]